MFKCTGRDDVNNISKITQSPPTANTVNQLTEVFPNYENRIKIIYQIQGRSQLLKQIIS